MDSLLLTGTVTLAFVVLLLALRVPIAVALALPSIIGLWASGGLLITNTILAQEPFEFTASWTLSSIPMFIFMGYVCFHSRIAEKLFSAAQAWFGRMPGGLAVASVFGGAGFAAVTGSSLAAAAAMGKISLPEMERYKYDSEFSAATLAAAGTLGSLIPPSILMIVYGVFAETSIAKLFIGGVIPGLLTAIGYAAIIFLRVRLKPSLAPVARIDTDWNSRIASILYGWPFGLLAVVVLGGLFSGLFTPTEAGAIGAFASMVIAALRKSLTWDVFKAAVVDTVSTSSSILFIAIGAALLTKVLSFTGVPAALTAVLVNFNLNAIELLIITSIVYIILGMFLDPLGCMLLTLPILLPLYDVQGVDLVWAGVLIVKLLEIGLITPPVGLNVFVISAITEGRTAVAGIFRNVTWFLISDIILIGLMIAFPSITLSLPGLIK